MYQKIKYINVELKIKRMKEDEDEEKSSE